MKGILFEKISAEQIARDCDLFFADPALDDREVLHRVGTVLTRISLPYRATGGSAGYDIVSPVNEELKPGTLYTIPTGLRCRMPEGVFLMILPRSGLASKYGMRLANTAPVIDSDYYSADNEGHILLKMAVDKPLTISAGDRIAQGIFLRYEKTEDDAPKTDRRTGGFGSTGGA